MLTVGAASRSRPVAPGAEWISPVDAAPVLAYLRRVDGWHQEGPRSLRLGNQTGDDSLPHLPTAGWRVEDEVVTAWADRHGLVRLYYYAGPDGFGLASSWVALQQRFSLTDLDDEAVACYLRLGHYLADDTPFVGIRRMPPGGKLAWRNGQLRVDAANDTPLQERSIGREAALAEYGQRFHDAVARICASSELDRISLVSGGQDSRHILLAMMEARFPPRHCLTQTPDARGNQDDAVIAERLCVALDLQCETVPPEAVSTHAEAIKNRAIGMDSAYHAWLLPLASRLDGISRGLVFDGLGGDTLSASRFLTDDWIAAYRAGRLREAASAYMGPEGHLPGMLERGWARRWPRELVADRLAAELGRFGGWPNPQAIFQLRNRTRRAIAPSLWPILTRGHDVALPYFDPEVFGFLASLPMEMLKGREFHRAAIEARYPRALDIPFASNGDQPSVADTGWPSHHAREALELANVTVLRRFVVPAYLRVRALRGCASRAYAASLPQLTRPAVYLAQLSALIERASARR